jgi:hypothetical protein
MNPYAAPGTQPRDAAADAERDIAEAAPPTSARIAGGVVALAGALVLLTGVQTLAVVSIRGALGLAPWALVVLGAVELMLATLVFRARAWSVVGAAAVSFVLMTAAGLWLMVSLSHGLFQLYGFAGPFVSLGAAVMALLAMGPSQRASAARARLKQQGMDLGI